MHPTAREQAFDVGMPLSVCIQLQESKLSLGAAQWTMRQSYAGFSYSLFWPAPQQAPVSKKRHRRRRKQPVHPSEGSPSCPVVTNIPSGGAKSEDSDPSSNAEDSILSNDHPDAHQQQEQPEHSKDHQAPELDLTSCNTIRYEMRDDVPGVTFSAEDGSGGWTPVVRRKRRAVTRPQKTQTPSSTIPESSDEELDVHLRKARQVEYKERDSTPGLRMRLGCTNRNFKWAPIVPSPVSTRTRSRLK